MKYYRSLLLQNGVDVIKMRSTDECQSTAVFQNSYADKMKIKKIAILGQSSRGGGSETFLRSILPCLATSAPAFEIHLFIPASRQHFYSCLPDNVRVYHVEDSVLDSPLRRLIYENYELIKMLRKIKPDVCLVNSEIFSPFLACLKKPVIIIYHAAIHFYFYKGMNESKIKLFYIRIMRNIAIKKARRVVAVSHFERGEIGGRYPKYMMDKILVIYHGIDHSSFNKDVLISAKSQNQLFDSPYILSVGDRHGHKQIEEMIDIYHKMRTDYSTEEHLVLVGRPKSEKIETSIQNKIKRYSLEKYVHLVDYVNNDDIKNYYLNASLYWTNSQHESFGLTPLEAMATGIPVLAVWRAALPEVCGDAALFYDPVADRSKKAEIAANFVKDVELRRKYKEKGLEHVKDFNWEKCAKSYLDLLTREIEAR